MKKILAILFFIWIIPTVLASDSAKTTENLMKICPVSVQNQTHNSIQSQNKIFKEVVLADYNGKIKHLYLNKNRKIQKLVKTNDCNFESSLNSKFKSLDGEFQAYANRSQKTIERYESILNLVSLRAMVAGKEPERIDLRNGNYILYFSDEPISIENYRNGSFMGIVKLNSINNSNERITQVFNEYMPGNNPSTGVELTYTIIVDINKSKNYVAQYIYNNKSQLICKKINNEIFITNEGKILLKSLSKWQINRNLAKIKNNIQTEINKKYLYSDIKDKFDTDLLEVILLPSDCAFLPYCLTKTLAN